MTELPGEKRNIAILVISQTLFMIASITVMTLSGMVGQQLASDPQLATLPIAIMMIGTLISTLPASLFMKRVGRRMGFIIGAILGISGGLVSYAGVSISSFGLFCVGNLLLGFYQGFAMYYRFAAVDVSSPTFRSRAISYVLAGGIMAAFLGPWNARMAADLIADVPNGAPYLVIALLAAVAVFLLSGLKVPVSGEPQSTDISRPMPSIAKQPAFLVAVIASSLGYAIMVLVMTATPLTMKSMSYEMADIAFIMQWHVLGMFVPSLFTGNLIARFGVNNILMAGAIILVGSAFIAMLDTTLPFFWFSLVLLGIGWNFLFVGGSTLLSTVHTETERGKVQGINDLIVFSFSALGSMVSGSLLHHLGWATLNQMMLPILALIVIAVLWLKSHRSVKPIVHQ